MKYAILAACPILLLIGARAIYWLFRVSSRADIDYAAHRAGPGSPDATSLPSP